MSSSSSTIFNAASFLQNSYIHVDSELLKQIKPTTNLTPPTNLTEVFLQCHEGSKGDPFFYILKN